MLEGGGHKTGKLQNTDNLQLKVTVSDLKTKEEAIKAFSEANTKIKAEMETFRMNGKEIAEYKKLAKSNADTPQPPVKRNAAYKKMLEHIKNNNQNKAEDVIKSFERLPIDQTHFLEITYPEGVASLLKHMEENKEKRMSAMFKRMRPNAVLLQC